VLLSN